MKKIISLLGICLSMLFVICGCSCSKEKAKVALMYGDVDATTYKTIDETELSAKIEAKKNFLLYYYDSTCSGCQAFKPILEEVIQEKQLLVYAVEISSLSSSSNLRKAGYSTPTLILYKEGEIFKVFQSDNDDYKQYFENKTGLEKFLTDYTYLPTIYYVNKATLASMVEGNKKFIIYFGNSNCSDCKTIESYFFNNYLKEHTDTNKMYIFDRSANEWEDGEWVEFKNTYGLSKVGSEEYGYGEGYTPTFQYREGSEIKAAVVLYNTFDATNLVTIEPYFSDDVASGTHYDSNNAYKEDRNSFYANKLNEFLNNNLSKVD